MFRAAKEQSTADDDFILDDDDEGEDEDFEGKVVAAVAGRQGRPGSAPRSRPQTASRSRAGSAERERQPNVGGGSSSTSMPVQGLGPGPAPPSRPSSAYIPEEQNNGAQQQRTRPASASAAEPAASGLRPATLAAKRDYAAPSAKPRPPRPQAQMTEDHLLTEEVRAVLDGRPQSAQSKESKSTSAGGSRPSSAGAHGFSRPSSANVGDRQGGTASGYAEPDDSLPPHIAYPGRLLGTPAEPSETLRPETLAGTLRPRRAASSSSLHGSHSSLHASHQDSAGVSGSTMKPPRPKSSQHYLRERRQRQKQREDDLANAIEQGGREVLYRHLYRMGEANEWAEQLGLSTRFRAFKAPSGEITCHVYEGRAFDKELSLDLFEKRYGTLKGRWNNVIAFRNKEDEEPAAGDAKSKGGGGNAMPTEAPHALTREQQERRQQEIRAALLNTIHLTQTLKEQLKILDKRAPGLTPFVIE